jgi:hypothetical protein
MEDDFQKNENGRRPKKGRRPIKIKWKTNSSTKINPMGCNIIIN